MSALGHKRTSRHVRFMSALPPKAEAKGSLMMPSLKPSVMSASQINATIVTDRHQRAFEVKIIAAIAAIWALSLLSLAFSLPPEFLRPTDPDDEAAEKPKIDA
jgi:hypothetical protein